MSDTPTHSIRDRNDEGPAVIDVTPPDPPVAVLNVEATLAQARARVDFLNDQLARDKQREVTATETRRQTEDDLKEAKRIVHALAGSPLRGRTKTSPKAGK